MRVENGRGRGELTTALIHAAQQDADLVVGLDFALSLPKRFLAERGYASVHDLWNQSEETIESWLASKPKPFFTSNDSKPDWKAEELLRRTDVLHGGRSPLKLVGNGQVGPMSLRGFRELARLSADGFAIWPFDPPSLPLVVEIYPAALCAGKVNKSSAMARRAYLDAADPDLDDLSRGIAIGSDDAFDAVVSARAMAARAGEFSRLTHAHPGSPEHLEGQIWA
jgi:hypothetical protein